MVSKKKDNLSMDDGDGAHWVKSKSKRKRVTPSDLNSSAKYTGKGKTTRKKVSGK